MPPQRNLATELKKLGYIVSLGFLRSLKLRETMCYKILIPLLQQISQQYYLFPCRQINNKCRALVRDTLCTDNAIVIFNNPFANG